MSDDYLISSNLANHITLGFNRWASLEATGKVAGGWPAKLGYGGLPSTDGAMLIFNIASGIRSLAVTAETPAAPLRTTLN